MTTIRKETLDKADTHTSQGVKYCVYKYIYIFFLKKVNKITEMLCTEVV